MKILKLKSWNWKNPIYYNLDNAIITNLKNVDKKELEKLKPLLKRYLNKNIYLTSLQIFL